MSEKKIKSEYQKKIKLLQKHNLLYYDKSSPKISDKDYDNLKEAWEKTMAYIEDNNLETVEEGTMLEIYPTDPSAVPNPADWKTEIYIEVK